MKAVTDRQMIVLCWIKMYIKARGYPPSRREIGDGVGIKSTSNVQYHIERLELAGCIECDRGVIRGIRVIRNE